MGYSSRQEEEDAATKKLVFKIITWASLGLVLLISLITFSCNRVSTSPGWEVVFNAKPRIFMWTGGVNNTSLREGATYSERLSETCKPKL
jgi:hypothetical protein